MRVTWLPREKNFHSFGSSDQCGYWWQKTQKVCCPVEETFTLFDTEDLLASIMVFRHMDFVVRVALERCVARVSEQITITPEGFCWPRDGVTALVQVFLYLHECRGKTHLLLICCPSVCHDAWDKGELNFPIMVAGCGVPLLISGALYICYCCERVHVPSTQPFLYLYCSKDLQHND